MTYSNLPNDEANVSDKEGEHGMSKSRGSRPRPWRRLVLMLFVSGTILSTLTLFIYDFQQSNAVFLTAENCGGSAEEAISLGCSFDIMSFAWLPARCFDRELMLDFLHLRQWQWFTDADGYHSVDQAAVAGGAYDKLFVTQEYHMYHCTYMWRKMHRAAQNGKPLDGYIGSPAHTDHCEKILVNLEGSLDKLTTSIMSKYVMCPWKRQNLGQNGWYRVVNGTEVKGFSD